MDIESFRTEGYAGQIPNSGHELTIYVCTMTIVKLCWHNFTQSAYFMIFSVSSISYRPIGLSLLKEFSKNVSFSNSYKLPSQSAVQKISMSTDEVRKISFQTLIICARVSFQIIYWPLHISTYLNERPKYLLKFFMCQSYSRGLESF